jgi:hypothetical protein
MTLKLNVLLLCNRPVRNADASTITDHLDALNGSGHNVLELSFLRNLPARLDLGRFDAIVIHYSIALGYMSDHYLSPATRQKIAAFKGLKVVFIQDEYRSINSVLKILTELDVGLLFTCIPTPEIDKVYPAAVLPNTTRLNTLTGYVPKALLDYPALPIGRRSVDVGYRTRKPPFWLGELGYEKWTISDRFQKAAEGTGLILDLSYDESARIYGPKWTEFVAGCKAMLGVESGASVFDFEGNLQQKVDSYVAEHPQATFQEVHEKFLIPHEGLIRHNQISPRCFEAAALRTVMVLFEGEYSGILKPWRHFLPLKKDFSNFEEIASVVRDSVKMQKIADDAFEEVARNPAYSYEAFGKEFALAVEVRFVKTGLRPVSNPYSRAQFFFALGTSARFVTHRLLSRGLQKLLLGTGLRKVIFRLWGGIPFNVRNAIRPLLRVIGR